MALTGLTPGPGLQVVLLTCWWTCLHLATGQRDQADLLLQVECEVSEDGYLVPDPVQCDRYLECTPHGKRIESLCTDGYGLNLQSGKCDLLSKVDCTDREKLQEPTGSGLCPRLNGNFPVSALISCSDYVDCREGQAFKQSCGYGAVFDPILGCVHPDQTTREGCTATEVFGFKCPKHNGKFRFGDHNRVSHPTDCAYFYACLSTGQPRLLGCEEPTVFNPESGICEEAANVPGCENYYPPQQKDADFQAERERIEEEIRAEIEAKFGLSAGSLGASKRENGVAAGQEGSASRSAATASRRPEEVPRQEASSRPLNAAFRPTGAVSRQKEASIAGATLGASRPLAAPRPGAAASRLETAASRTPGVVFRPSKAAAEAVVDSRESANSQLHSAESESKRRRPPLFSGLRGGL